MVSHTEGAITTTTATMNLLHAGAGLHGHEYSPPSAPSSRSPRIPLRSYNSTPVQLPGRPNSYQDTTKTTNTSANTYIRPARRLSNSRRRTITERVSFLDSPIDIARLNISSAMDDGSDDGMSITSSIFSGTTEFEANPCKSGNVRKKKATKHSETKYYMAGPAPTMLQKQRFVHIRPRTVLQLQKLPKNGRATPILDVKSSNTFVPRIAKKFPSLYKGSGQLGVSDVMICKSENYDDEMEEDGDGGKTGKSVACGTEKWDEKEVIAVICQAPKDSGHSGELVFDDGSRWIMAAGTRGKSFELTKTDTAAGEKTIARWVPAGTSRRSSFQTSITKKAIGAAEMAKEAKEAKGQKYNFSLVDPTKRRHPIMATLRQTGLVVKDTYSPITDSPANSSSALAVDVGLDTSAQDSAVEAGPSDYPSLSDAAIIRTTDQQKLLIEISAMWLASRLGWCPWPDPTQILPTFVSSSKSTPSSGKSAARQRSNTVTPSGSAKHKRQRSGTVGSIAEGAVDETTTLESNKGSLSKRSGNIFKRSSLNNGVFQSESGYSPPRVAPQRSVSTGAAFMAKQAEKRASRPPSEAGSRPGSTSVSRNNSRPSSPKRACSMDLLTSLGRDVRHGEALTRGLRKYQLNEVHGRDSAGGLGASPGIRRTQSDFTTLDGPREGISSPHIKIGEEPIVPIATPNPLLVAHQDEAAMIERRESSYVKTTLKKEKGPWTGEKKLKRSKSVPSKKSKAVTSPSSERAPKKKVSKMKLFIGLFSKAQRRKNEAAEEERVKFQG